MAPRAYARDRALPTLTADACARTLAAEALPAAPHSRGASTSGPAAVAAGSAGSSAFVTWPSSYTSTGDAAADAAHASDARTPAMNALDIGTAIFAAGPVSPRRRRCPAAL